MLIGVTGATGFIGQQLVIDLLDTGHTVKALVRSSSSDSGKSLDNRARPVSGDLLKPATLIEFCEGCEAIIHLAALSHVTNTRASDHEKSTVTGTQNLLDAMRSARVGRLIFISSIKASNDAHASAYARAKAAAEDLVREESEQGLNSIILRPAIVYGPGMKGNLSAWMRKIQQGRAPRLPSVSTRLQMIDREDLCRGIIKSLDLTSLQANKYVLHDGQVYGINALEQAIFRASGVKLPAFALPGFCWWLAAKTGDALFSFTGKSLGFSSYSWRTLFCQEEPATKLLPGFEPVHQFEERLPAILAVLHGP